MTCDELAELLPDLVDGTLSDAQRVEAEAALAQCPDCQRQLELARQLRLFLVQLQHENDQFRVPAGFEARLLARVQQQRSGLELLDLSSQTFVLWLVELIELIGGLLDPNLAPRISHPQST